jgi:hypothetical protein
MIKKFTVVLGKGRFHPSVGEVQVDSEDEHRVYFSGGVSGLKRTKLGTNYCDTMEEALNLLQTYTEQSVANARKLLEASKASNRAVIALIQEKHRELDLEEGEVIEDPQEEDPQGVEES